MFFFLSSLSVRKGHFLQPAFLICSYSSLAPFTKTRRWFSWRVSIYTVYWWYYHTSQSVSGTIDNPAPCYNTGRFGQIVQKGRNSFGSTGNQNQTRHQECISDTACPKADRKNHDPGTCRPRRDQQSHLLSPLSGYLRPFRADRERGTFCLVLRAGKRDVAWVFQ